MAFILVMVPDKGSLLNQRAEEEITPDKNILIVYFKKWL